MNQTYVVFVQDEIIRAAFEASAPQCHRMAIPLRRASTACWSMSQMAMACWEQGETNGVGLAMGCEGDQIELAWQSQSAAGRWRGQLSGFDAALADLLRWDGRPPCEPLNLESDSVGWQFVGWQFVGWQFVGWQFVGWQFVGWQFVGWQFSFPGGEWHRLFSEDLVGHRLDGPPSSQVRASSQVRVVFPGAFNPIHDGHRGMVRCAERRLGERVELELSVWNVDKPPLDFFEINQRIRGLSEFRPCWLTRAATFLEKARLFPAATFVVGDDTIRRVLDRKYYSSDVAKTAAHRELLDLGSRFLIFGRQHGGDFRTIRAEELPAEFRDVCEVVPEQEFRSDVTSSSIRGRTDFGLQS